MWLWTRFECAFKASNAIFSNLHFLICTHDSIKNYADITFIFLHGINIRNMHLLLLLLLLFHFYFLLPISRESIVLGVKFSKWRFWWICTFWGSLNPKITFLAFGLCVCVSVCYQHNSKTNYSRIFKFLS